MQGFGISHIAQYVIGLAIIISLLAILALLVISAVRWRVGIKLLTKTGQDRGSLRPHPRLGIIDVYDLDRQRQLVLVRRDNIEHVVMLGGPNDLVVESRIARVPIGGTPVSEQGRMPEWAKPHAKD